MKTRNYRRECSEAAAVANRRCLSLALVPTADAVLFALTAETALHGVRASRWALVLFAGPRSVYGDQVQQVESVPEELDEVPASGTLSALQH